MGGKTEDGQRGGAAIEMLLLFPFIVLINCFIIQISQLFVCYQVGQYAAFAAARAALVADVDPAQAPPGTNWMSKAGDPEFDRVVQAAAQMCSVLEIMAPSDDVKWIKNPIRLNKEGYSDFNAPPKYRLLGGVSSTRARGMLESVKVALPSGPNEDEVRVTIVYDAFLAVPFANRIVYEAFKASGRGAGEYRIRLIQSCTVVKPWM